MFQTTFIPQGWECPKCKRVYSPTTNMCSHCPQNNYGTVSTGTSTNIPSTGTSTNIPSIHYFERIGTTDICKICGKKESSHPVSYI